MRLYAFMMNIGVVSMLTLAGYSFFMAGLVSSTIAFVLFLISPRIGKLIDERGQSKVVPFACAINLVGLAIMLVDVVVSGPEWLFFVAAVLMGFIPNPQALVRARWTYLIRSGKLGKDAPTMHAVFSYEGVLDDVGFMLGPPVAIVLASSITPIAGILIGGIFFIVGCTMLTLAKSSEPEPGWKAADEMDDAPEGLPEGNASDASGNHEDAHSDAEGAVVGKAKSIFRVSSLVRVLFVLMFLAGTFLAMLDTSSVAFAEELGNPSIASIGMVLSAIASITVGLLFGSIHIRIAPYKQLLLFAVLLGVSFATMALIDSAMSFIIIITVASFFFAPFFITANAACERAVPGARLTEAITWINAGQMCGVAIGPTISGIIVDLFGGMVGFDFAALVSICIPIIAFCCYRIIKREVKEEKYEVMRASSDQAN